MEATIILCQIVLGTKAFLIPSCRLPGTNVSNSLLSIYEQNSFEVKLQMPRDLVVAY